MSRARKTICMMPIDNLGVRDGSPNGSATASRTGMVPREFDAQTARHDMDAGGRGAPSRCWALNGHSLHAALRLAFLRRLMAFWRCLLDHGSQRLRAKPKSPSLLSRGSRGVCKFGSALKIAVPGWRDTELHRAKRRSEARPQPGPVIRCFTKGFALVPGSSYLDKTACVAHTGASSILS